MNQARKNIGLCAIVLILVIAAKQFNCRI